MIMKITRYISFILLLISFGCSPDDSSSPDPDEIFIKYFGVSGNQTAVDLIYNEDLNQFFILGSQTLSGGNTDFYYAIANEAGNFIDEDVVNFKFTLEEDVEVDANDVPTSIKPLNDGTNRYLVVGTSTIGDDSKIVWGIISHDLQTQEYFEVTNEENDLIGADIVKIPGEDNVLIFGTTSTVYDGDQVDKSTAGKQLFISKRTISNELIWVKSSGSSGDDIALEAFALDNGGFALFGSTERDENSHTGTNVLVKFTSSLGIEDGVDAAYGFDSAPSNNNVISDVIRGSGSDYKVVGTSSTAGANPNAFVLGITSFGTRSDATVMNSSILNNKLGDKIEIDGELVGANINTSANTIVRTYSGDFMVMGSFPNYEVGGNSRLEEMMIMRINANGIKIDGKDRSYGLEAGNDVANKAIALPSGKIAVIGTFDFGSGINLIGLLKLNLNGELRN